MGACASPAFAAESSLFVPTWIAVWITDRQIEAGRIAITRFVKRGGKVWIRIFPDKPVTTKPAETRMGTGQGAPKLAAPLANPANYFELTFTVQANVPYHLWARIKAENNYWAKAMIAPEAFEGEYNSDAYYLQSQTQVSEANTSRLRGRQ